MTFRRVVEQTCCQQSASLSGGGEGTGVSLFAWVSLCWHWRVFAPQSPIHTSLRTAKTVTLPMLRDASPSNSSLKPTAGPFSAAAEQY
jgi:hypothetical protein